MPSSGLSGPYGSFSPSFLSNCILFSIMAVSIYIPTILKGGSLFSTLSPAFIICRFFDDSHSDWCEVILHCSFDLHFRRLGLYKQREKEIFQEVEGSLRGQNTGFVQHKHENSTGSLVLIDKTVR